MIDFVYSAAGRHRVVGRTDRHLTVEVYFSSDYPSKVRLDRAALDRDGRVDHRGVTYATRPIPGAAVRACPTPAGWPLSLLELPDGATAAEIRRAFRRLAREHHPDAGGDAEAFRALRAAYEAAIGG